jgi:translocator protein
VCYNEFTMPTSEWYQTLARPSWAPPAAVFGPVWTVLYVLIAISFGYVFYRVVKKQIPARLTWPFALNLIFNFAFTPIQFGLQNNIMAALDILLVLATLIWAMAAVWKHHRWVVYINIPYLAWVAFATALQLTITMMNLP